MSLDVLHAVLNVLCLIWLCVYAWRVVRGAPALGAVLSLSLVLLTVGLLWAGTSIAIALGSCLGFACITIMPCASVRGPWRFRITAIGSVGLAVLAGVLQSIHVSGTSIKITTVAMVFIGALGCGVFLLLGLDTPATDSDEVNQLARPGLYKYTYFSLRALRDLESDNMPKTRVSFKVRELKLPSLKGILPEVTLGREGEQPLGRHELATQIDRTFAGHIHADPEAIIKSQEQVGLLRGVGHIWGSEQGVGDSLPAREARATFFTEINERAAPKIAVCMFGSKDNLSSYIQDAHPEPVTGWAASSTGDFIKWLTENEEYPAERWNESVGSSALLFVNAEAARGVHSEETSWSDYARSLLFHQKNAEWLAIVYYVEAEARTHRGDYDSILIARPIYIRSRHVNIKTSDEYSLSQMHLANAGKFRAPRDKRLVDILNLDTTVAEWPHYALAFIRGLRGS